MATNIRITLVETDLPDILGGLQSEYRDAAVRLYFANSDAAYAAASVTAKITALIKACLVTHAARYRHLIHVSIEPVVT